MPTKRWTVVDAAGGAVNDFVVTAEDVGDAARGVRLERRTLHGGLSEGVTTLRVDNGALAFTILPTRGLGLWKAWLGDREIGWQSPVRGPVHPQFVNVGEPSGLGWLDGFDELLTRCGLESNGAPEFDAESGRLVHPLHGRIANRPAHACEASIDSESGEIVVTGVVDETRFLFSKLRLTTKYVTRPGENSVTIIDTIENLSASPATAQMLYHVNFGAPLLEAGARVVAPVCELVPRTLHAAEGLDEWDRYAAPQAGFAEQVYFLMLASDADERSRVLLKNARGDFGVSLHFNLQQLPCFSVWKNTAASEDGYVTGLEPGTNFPNPRSFETRHDRVIKLPPGGKQTLELRLEAHGNASEVSQAEAAIAALQQNVTPEIHARPHADWCS